MQGVGEEESPDAVKS